MIKLIESILRPFSHQGEARSWTVYKDAINTMGATTATGTVVSSQGALGIAAVYACCRVLGESMANLPLQVFQKQADGSRVKIDHPVSRLLALRPNPRMTAFEWREVTVTHLNLRGNAYTRIKRDENGVPVELWPLYPDHVEILNRPGVGLVYRYQPTSSTDQVADFAAEDILHFKGLSPNGLKGYDPLTLERETFGHYIEAQRYGAEALANDATPTGLLKHPGELGKEARNRVNASWMSAHGKGSRGAVAILEEGMEFQAISITPENLQFIETLKFKRSDIAGIFKVPPHMIGDLDNATYSNIEHQDLAFAKHTLSPWCERMEQVLMDGLLNDVEQERGFYIEHNLDAISRGDMKSRMESYGMLWDRGAITQNEIRQKENMNNLEGGMGDVPFVPLNFVPVTAVQKEPPAPEAQEAPEPEPDSDDGQRMGQPRERRQEAREALWKTRQGIQRASVATIEDAARRVVRRDVQNVRAATRKKQSARELIDWIEDYFDDVDYAVKQYTPVIRSLAESLGASMAAEAGQDWTFTEPLRAWVEKYIQRMAEFHSGAAKVQLIKLIEEAEATELPDAIEGRLEEWEAGTSSRASRSHAIANHESHRFGGAWAVTAFAAAGVTALVWRATGETCPWCLELDGTVVGVGEPFMTESDEMEKDGQSFKPSKPVIHPPLHSGCDCIVGPE